MRNGGTCVLKDDMAEILGMFRKADVLVLYLLIKLLLIATKVIAKNIEQLQTKI